MASRWIVLELTPKGEKENPGQIIKAVRRSLPGAEVYVPAVETEVGEDKAVHYLMQGYAFVLETDPPRPLRAYFKLEGSKFVQRVLQQGGRPAYIDSAYIEDMKEKVRVEVNQGIGEGDSVVICSGPYKNIEAAVIMELPETKEVQVFIQLRSKQALLTLPRSVLKVVERAPLSPYFARIGYLRSWARLTKALLNYNPPYQQLVSTYSRYEQVTSWGQKGNHLFSFVHGCLGSFDKTLHRIQTKFQILEKTHSWHERIEHLQSFVTFNHVLAGDRSQDLRDGLARLVALDSIEDRLLGLSRDVEGLARDAARQKKADSNTMSVQNIIVDGHNLAHRCYHAPGMGLLKDRQGNLTGVILGFLKSLGALKRRFPEARFWVTWDGTSQRRKRLYHDYKAGRKTARFKDQEDFLKTVLPPLGVAQAINPDEEADDVVASLVRGPLKGETCIIYSSDRDFMQLVGDHVGLLVPSTGSRKEILFDAEGVKQTMGVGPEKVVELRAFLGDTSDNLPGVPRVPKKILRALMIAHGSVEGVYSSGLSGLNKGQYERLRTAESQVRINRELMALSVVEFTVVDPCVNAAFASQLLGLKDIQPDPIQEAFFPR